MVNELMVFAPLCVATLWMFVLLWKAYGWRFFIKPLAASLISYCWCYYWLVS